MTDRIAVEVTAAEVKEIVIKSIIEGSKRRDYEDEIRDRVSADVVKDVRKEFESQIKSAVSSAISEAVKEQIASGFFTTGQYGDKTQKTLNQLIQEQLKELSGYGDKSQTMVARVLASEVDRVMRSELAEELKKLRAEFAAIVKGKLTDAAVTAMAQAMGVK
jgi:hypothetical protein